MVKQNGLAKKRVLIIGAGQVGVFASKFIGESGADVFMADIKPQAGFIYRFGDCKDIVKADVTDAARVKQLFLAVKPHIVIIAHGITTSNISKNKALAHRVNVNSVEIIAAAAVKYRVKRIIYLSSFAVYKTPGISKQPLIESSALSKKSLYASQKLNAEKKLTQIAGKHAEIIILRPCGCYGPTLFNKGSQSSVFIESLLILAANNKPIKLYDEGEEELLYVKDLARAISNCCYCKLPESINIFNIGSGHTYTIKEIKKALKNNFKTLSINTFKTADTPGQNAHGRPVLSFEKARSMLHFIPAYNLSEGIRDYLGQVNFKIR